VGGEARPSPGCSWQGEQRRGGESRGKSPTRAGAPLLTLAVWPTRQPASASRLAAALAACRDLLIASSLRALFSISPSPCFFLSLVHPAEPLCPHLHLWFSSSSLLSFSSSIFSFSVLFSHCAFHPSSFFVLFPAIELFSSFMQPLPWVFFFSPHPFPPLALCAAAWRVS